MAAPKPVSTPQESRQATSSATCAGSVTTCEASTTTLSAKPPTRSPARTGLPCTSARRGAESMAYAVVHWAGLPAAQYSQCPHERSSETSTRSPTPMPPGGTAGPRSVTTPANSCPNTVGSVSSPPQPPSM